MPPAHGVKPKLLLMGLKRSGKSSITNVVFDKGEPSQTVYLESTTRIEKNTFQSFMDFQIWDFPGQIDYLDSAFDGSQYFSEIGALVWVIDSQDEYNDSLNRLVVTIMNLHSKFPHINIEVFLHKTDSLNSEFQADVYQDVTQKVADDLNDAGIINPNISYHMTSIYDTSIFEALSQVIQKLVHELNPLQNLLNTLADNTSMRKVYLFDIRTKIYIASDTRPVDMEAYEMCSAHLDAVVDLISLYDYERTNHKARGEQMSEVESSIMMENAPGLMFYLKEINTHLSLCAIIDHPKAKEAKGRIDYNVHVIQDAVKALFDRAWEREGKGSSEEGEMDTDSVNDNA